MINRHNKNRLKLLWVFGVLIFIAAMIYVRVAARCSVSNPQAIALVLSTAGLELVAAYFLGKFERIWSFSWFVMMLCGLVASALISFFTITIVLVRTPGFCTNIF